jgi:hypothetical protein
MTDFRRLRTQVEKELAESERRTEALRQVLDGLAVLGVDGAEAEAVLNGNGHSGGNGNGLVPRGMDAVRAVVTEGKPGKAWSREQIAREMERRGWSHSPDRRKLLNNIDAAIHRMREKGEAKRVRAGVYRFPVEAQEVVPA